MRYEHQSYAYGKILSAREGRNVAPIFITIQATSKEEAEITLKEFITNFKKDKEYLDDISSGWQEDPNNEPYRFTITLQDLIDLKG